MSGLVTYDLRKGLLTLNVMLDEPEDDSITLKSTLEEAFCRLLVFTRPDELSDSDIRAVLERALARAWADEPGKRI